MKTKLECVRLLSTERETPLGSANFLLARVSHLTILLVLYSYSTILFRFKALYCFLREHFSYYSLLHCGAFLACRLDFGFEGGIMVLNLSMRKHWCCHCLAGVLLDFLKWIQNSRIAAIEGFGAFS